MSKGLATLGPTAILQHWLDVRDRCFPAWVTPHPLTPRGSQFPPLPILTACFMPSHYLPGLCKAFLSLKLRFQLFRPKAVALSKMIYLFYFILMKKKAIEM